MLRNGRAPRIFHTKKWLLKNSWGGTIKEQKEMSNSKQGIARAILDGMSGQGRRYPSAAARSLRLIADRNPPGFWM